MPDKIAMNHPEYRGAIANPNADDVPVWEAKGWVVIPVHPKKRAPKIAKMKGHRND